MAPLDVKQSNSATESKGHGLFWWKIEYWNKEGKTWLKHTAGLTFFMECFWSQNCICQNEDILQEHDISAEIGHSSDGPFSDHALACQATLILATGS